MTNLMRRALRIAASQIGVRETAPNRGPAVNAYLKSVGLGPGQRWCAAFVSWCISQAAAGLGATDPLPNTGSCEQFRLWAKKHSALHAEPQTGDVFLVVTAGRAHHTGFVESVGNGRVITIEGNTNVTGSSEGIGVFRRSRGLKGLVFVRV